MTLPARLAAAPAVHRPARLIGALVLVLAFTLPARAAPPDAPTLQRQLDALLARRVAADGPGVVLLVARGEQLLYRGARGMANIELGVPLAPEHALRIASVTKQFAAAALLQLVDSGRARLDDPLSKYLPDYPNGSAITLAQLLNHSSGVKSYTGIPGYMRGAGIRRDLTTAELVQVFSGLPVDFAPGAGWSYSNSGYVLVGAVIEAITKRPWHAQVAAMLQPLAITRTRFDDLDTVIPGLAQGYGRSSSGGVARAGLVSMTQPHAAGALVSTVDELWRWNLALHRGAVLTPESYRRMRTPEGEPAQKAAYGYGLHAEQLRGQPFLQHGGGIHGFKSLLGWLPREQLTVVVLHNSDSAQLHVGTLGRQVAALALGQPFPDGPTVAASAAEQQALPGVWRRADGGTADTQTLRLQGTTLTLQRSGARAVPLRAIGGGVFLFESGLHRIETAADGRSLRYFHDGEGSGETWQRVGELPAEGQPAASAAVPQ